MFLDNKYSKVYYRIVHNAKQNVNEYFERHHIIPKCLDGELSPSNIVKLTAREHFICHLLLIKMVDDKHKSKLVYAAWQLGRKGNIKSRQYEYLKKQLSESYRGRKRKPFSVEWKNNMSLSKIGSKNNMYGKTHTNETKSLISKKRKGKLCGEDNPFYGKSHNEETIIKLREVNSRTSTCPHCGISGKSNVMKRWHFDKCRERIHSV